MDYKVVIIIACLVLLGLAVCVVVMQSDPATQDLRLEAARKEVEYRERIAAAREQAEQEIAAITERAAAKKAQLLEPREEPRKSEEPREIEAPPKIEGPGFFEKPAASAPTPAPALLRFAKVM